MAEKTLTMSLDELNEKLYGRDAHINREKHTPFDPGQGASDPNVQSQFQRTENWRAPEAKRTRSIRELLFTDVSGTRRFKRRTIAFGILGALVIIGGLIFFLRAMIFSEERVQVAVIGPQSVASAEEVTFTITYENDNWRSLKNAMLIFSYPESFHPQDENGKEIKGPVIEIPIGKVTANAKGRAAVKGKFYGFKGDVAYLKAALRYSQGGAEAVFEKTVQVGTNIFSSPLSLEITAPLEAASGHDVEYVIDYGNASDIRFPNMRVKLEYPSGFQFVSSEPRPSEGESIWYVGNLKARANGKIIVRGVLTGASGEQKRVRGTIGFFNEEGKFLVYAENERPTRMIVSPFSIYQIVNGATDVTANPGEALRYVIRYRNESRIGMRDVIVTVEINPEFLDMSQLVLTNGAYDAARKIIVWKASDVSALGRIEPGAGGELSFSVPVFKEIQGASAQNLSIKSVVKIDSPDIPMVLGSNKIIGSNTLVVKLNSPISLDTRVVYEDAVFPNTGPLPPKVGQETSYTFHLNVANSLNALKEARVSIVFPGSVHYTGKFFPEKETVVFNERTNELVWELGVFDPTKSAPRELVFQVAAIPAPSNIDKPLTLINNITFTGKDAFTNRDMRVEQKEIENFLRYEPSQKFVSGYVVPAD